MALQLAVVTVVQITWSAKGFHEISLGIAE